MLAGTLALDATGNDAANVLQGNLGANILAGGDGADSLAGDAGNDVLIYDAADVHVAGGSGIDTLRFDGADQTLDLSAIGDQRYSGIERIDLSGSGDNSLTLNLNDVLALPDHNNLFLANGYTQLRVDGDAGDSVTSVGQGWSAGDNVSLGGTTLYTPYTHAGSTAMLLLDTELTQHIS